MCHYSGMFAVTYLAHRSFNRQSLRKPLSDALLAMGYSTESLENELVYERGYRTRQLIDEATMERYFPETDIHKLLFSLQDLRSLVAPVFRSDQYEACFDSECHMIYERVYASIVEAFPHLRVLAVDRPLEGYTCIYAPKDNSL